MADKHYLSVDKWGREILTVGRLKEILAGAKDDLHVVTDDKNGWYDNVQTVVVPDVDGDFEFSAVTFVPGEGLDPRQF